MKAHLKKNASSYGIAIAIITSMTSVILNHFFPQGDETAREKVTQSHNAVKETVTANNHMFADEIDKLEERLDNERAKRRALEDKVRALEDVTHYFHGNNIRHRIQPSSDAPHDVETNEEENTGGGATEDMSNKIREVPALDKF